MKVILDISILVLAKKPPLRTMLRKIYETGLYPIPGIKIADSAWKEPKKPKSISCSFDAECYNLLFENVEKDTKEN